jgi:hypothetical protein
MRGAMTLADRVTSVLDESRVAHALIGATALAAAGVVRSTLDIDVLALDGRSRAISCCSRFAPAARRTCGTSASCWMSSTVQRS